MIKYKMMCSFCIAALCFFNFSFNVSATEDTYEQEADTVADTVLRPNPMENNAARMRSVEKTVRDMGFSVISVRNAGKKRFIVRVKGWNAKKMRARFRGKLNGFISAKGKRGRGRLVVIAGKNGYYVTKKSIKNVGVKLNSAKINMRR